MEKSVSVRLANICGLVPLQTRIKRREESVLAMSQSVPDGLMIYHVPTAQKMQ